MNAWLFLLHQLPAQPSRARVGTWRRLQKVGAVFFRNSVWVLPASKQSREDFEWIKTEIRALGGEASVFTAEGVDAETEEEMVASFRKERGRDFEAIGKEAARLSGRRKEKKGERRQGLDRGARLLRERWSQVAAVDFFGAPGREESLASLERLEALARGRPAERRAAGAPALRPRDFRGRTWVTRPRPGIDRMASAWLIRRFIDPRPRFRFAEQTAGLDSSAVPFDMYGVELGHQGARCTFETLAERFGIESPAVRWLGRIVHDVDLRDNAFGLPEAPVVGALVEGLRQMYADDAELLERGSAVFEALHRSFAEPKAASRPRRSTARARRRRK
jgi:hypothetical protein